MPYPYYTECVSQPSDSRSQAIASPATCNYLNNSTTRNEPYNTRPLDSRTHPFLFPSSPPKHWEASRETEKNKHAILVSDAAREPGNKSMPTGTIEKEML